MMKRLIAVLCVLAMLLTLVPMAVFAGDDVILPADEFEDDPTEFVVLSTTDMHGKCWDTNVLTDGAESNNMLRVKTAVNQIRNTYGAGNVLLIDNGDLYQGTPVSSVQLNRYTQGLSEDPLAMAVCLADIGYTAAGLGNHEFNYPWKTMQDARAYLLENGVPTICANLYYEETGENVFTPYIIKTVNVSGKALKIGILGLESTDCTRWDIPDNYPGIIFHHPDNPDCSIAWEAEHYIPAMKADGCDFIIVAYHGGTGAASGDLIFGTNTEGQATRLIAQTEGIDMVIAGHDHSTGYTNTYIKNKNGEDVLIVNGGGTQLTKTVFTVATDGTVSVKSKENLSLSGYASDAGLKAKIQPYADLASEYVNQEAGKCIGTWDTESSFYLKQSDSMDLIQAAQIYEGSKHIAEKFDTPEKQAALFEATGLDHIDIDLSSTSVVVSGSYRVKAGSMTMKDIYRLYKYDNNLYVLPMTGAQIKAVLEQNASTRLRASVKNGTVSYSTIGEDFTNPVFGGMNFTYDMYQPEGERVIIEGFANGRAFDPEATYLVAVNNYHLGNVGCGFGAYATTDAIWSQTDDMGGGVVQDLILEYLSDITAEKGGVDPATFNWTWKLDYTGDPTEEQGISGSIIAQEAPNLYDGQQILIYSDAAGGVMGLEPAENPARLGCVPATLSGKYLGTNEPAAVFTVVALPTPGEDTQLFIFALMTESGNYLTSGETGNSLGFSAEISDLSRWYAEEVDGGWHIRNVGAAYNGNHNQGLEWYTGFTTYGVSDTAAFLFNIYEPVETASVAEELEDGGRYAIYYDAEGTFLSTEELNGGLAPVTNTVNGGKLFLPASETTLIINAQIVATDGETPLFTFCTDDGLYLTAGDTGNSLFLSDTCNDMSKWYLVPVEGGFHIMNVGAAYNGNHNQAIEFYSGKFTTYGVQDTGIYLYNFYELGAVTPPAPCDHENTELRNASEPTCTEDGYTGDTYCLDCGKKIASGSKIPALGHDYVDGVCSRCGQDEPTETASVAAEVKDGGRYAIYYDAEGTFISTEALSGGLAPVTNTVDGGELVLPADEKTLIVNAEIVATDGETPIYTFKTDDGLYLTSGDTGSALFLSETCNDMSKWYLVAVDGGWHIMNVGAAYNDNHNQAIEYYSGKFTTYGVKDTAIYVYNFYDLGEDDKPIEDCHHENTELLDAKEATCTENGYTGDIVCADCGMLIEKGEPIWATGHLFHNGFCEVCGEPCPHDNTETYDYEPATCTEEGHTGDTVCLDCGMTLSMSDLIPLLGHDYVDGFCSRCGEEDPEHVVHVDPCEGYIDIDRNGWYHDAADFVLARGLMGSTKTDALTFEPMTSCTRAMIATMLYSLEGKPAVSFEAKFPDVKQGQWFTDAVMWAYQNGVVTGYDNGNFGPNDKVTREQMAVILKAYTEKVKGLDTTKTADLSKFADAAKVTWSKSFVSWAVAEGLISGKANGGVTYLDPQGNATRAEVAAIMMSLITKVVGE